MLGTRTTYSTEIRAAKPHSWRIPIIVVAVLVVIGAGGWWMVQNGQGTSTGAGPGTTAAVAADGLQATIGRAAPTVVGDTGTAATAQLGAAQATSQATAPAAQQVVISGVAGVKGASVWNDDGNLVGTLDSGSLVSIRARTSDSAWLSVETEAGAGWVQAPAVIAYGLQRLATAMLPDAVALANIQAALVPAATAATDANILAVALPGAGSSDAAAADAVPATTSSADSSQSVKDASGQLTAKVAAADSRLNIRSGPGTDYLVIAKAGDGEEYNVIGRNNAGDWLLLQLSDDTRDVGWASTSFIELSGNSQTLPVAE